jgi:hypothetical protein
VRLHAAAPQQTSEQVLVDAPQPLHAEVGAELVEHPGGGTVTPQPCEPPPRPLLGQLRDEEIERTGRRQQGQQMHAPELRRTESVTATAGVFARQELRKEVIGHVIVESFEQCARSNRRQSGGHARTLTQAPAHDTPLVSA